MSVLTSRRMGHDMLSLAQQTRCLHAISISRVLLFGQSRFAPKWHGQTASVKLQFKGVRRTNNQAGVEGKPSQKIDLKDYPSSVTTENPPLDLPPFPMRVAVVGSMVGIATPLYVIGGVFVVWWRLKYGVRPFAGRLSTTGD